MKPVNEIIETMYEYDGKKYASKEEAWRKKTIDDIIEVCKICAPSQELKSNINFILFENPRCVARLILDYAEEGWYHSRGPGK